MRYIKIIRGAYGHRRNGSTLTEVKTPASEPFQVPEEEAARLVELGVAKYVERAISFVDTDSDGTDDSGTNDGDSESGDNGVATATGGANEHGEVDNPSDGENGAGGAESDRAKPEYSVDMKADELKELLRAVGLPVRTAMSKVECVALLDAYYSAPEDDADGELPDLEAAEPVS